MSSLLNPGDLNRRITIERPTPNPDADGAGSGTWTPIATVWAEVQDMLPSRSERLADGLTVATRPARVRMRWRTDVTAAMRFVFGSRTMQIVAGPAEMGYRDGLEFMVEDYSSAGNAA